VVELRLRPVGQPIRYWPGQYVTLGNPRADIPARAYSISNAPRPDGELVLQVARADGGVTSNWVHDSLGVPVTYVISNPSSYAYPDDARPTIAAYSLTANAPGYIPATPKDAPAFRPGDGRHCTTYDQWPFGLNNRTGYSAKQTDDQIRKQMAARPTTLLLGEIDILPLGGFDGSCPAMAQGPTRLARGEAFAKRVNEKFAAKHTVTMVPLCGHNARCMFTSEAALPLLFPRN